MSNLQKFNSTITNEKTQQYLQQVLGDKRNSFVNNITALVANNQALQECEPITVMYAGIKATALDLPLDPNLGLAYVLPYKDNKKGVTLAQFQLGYKAYIQLALRTGKFQTINVTDVREGEIEDKDFISGIYKFKELSGNREKAKIIGYVAYFKLLNGFEKMLYMTIDEIEAHGKRFSQTYKRGYGVWVDDFNGMAEKTVIKKLLSKYAPLSIEMQESIKYDQSVINDNGVEYIDNADIEIIEENNKKVAKLFKDAIDSKKQSATKTDEGNK